MVLPSVGSATSTTVSLTVPFPAAGAGAAAGEAAGDEGAFMTTVLMRGGLAVGAGVVPGAVPMRRVGSFERPVGGGVAGGLGAGGGEGGLVRASCARALGGGALGAPPTGAAAPR